MPFFWKNSCYPESSGPGTVGPACQCCGAGGTVVQAGNATAHLPESYVKISFDFLVFPV